MSRREPLLMCQSLSKNFGALAALNDVSFDVWPGEVLGVGGPNGAGKTTLFDVITGLVGVDRGTIVFSGREIQQQSPWAISHCGLARTFQLNAGFDTLTVRENVLIAAHFGSWNRVMPRLWFDADSVRRTDEALELVGMLEMADEVIKDMKVLDRKLIMLACVLSKNPKLILLDEPVGGLNLEEMDVMANIVARLRDRGTSLVIIEHIMRFLVQQSDRALILHHGQKIYEGPTSDLINDETVVEVYLGAETATRMRTFVESHSTRDESTA